MAVYEGDCVGGPHDGQRMTHWSKKKEIFRPVPGRDPITIGEYRLNDFQQWHWWPTEDGKAMDQLFGEPQS